MHSFGKKVIFASCLVFSSLTYADPVLTVEVNLPKLDVEPYHRPYVAIWLETLDRKAVATLAVWREDDQWSKDLRQWWRKVGRKAGPEVDGVTSATYKPGKHVIRWNGKSNTGELIVAGEYLLNVEAVREEGGRSYLRHKVVLGKSIDAHLPAKEEFGDIFIRSQ